RPFAGSAPLAETVPQDETDQRVVDFVDKAPQPVLPKRLEGIERRAADQDSAGSRIRLKPPPQLARNFDVNLPIMVKVQTGIEPRAVRLVPNAPIPFANNLAAPLLDTAPHQFAAALHEPPPGRDVVEGRRKSRQGDHRCGARRQHGLDAASKTRPILYRA